MKFCVRCGAQLEDDAKFCMTCGAQQPAAPQAQQPYAPQAQQPYTPVQGGSPFAPGGQPGAPVPPPQSAKGGKGKGRLKKTLVVLAAVIVSVITVLALDAWQENHAEKVKRQIEEETVAYVKDLVQFELDSYCLRDYDEDFLETLDMTPEEVEADYEDRKNSEIEDMAASFDINPLPEDLRAEFTAFVENIYSHIKFEVGSVDYGVTSCTVEVTVYPMDLFSPLADAIAAGDADWFLEKYAGLLAGESVDEETYETYNREWAELILSMMNPLLEDVSYTDPVTLQFTVSQRADMDNRWQVTDESITAFENSILAEPPETVDDGAAA